VIAATGLYAAYDSIGLRVSNLIDSAYGRTLSLKVAIAAVAILVGGYNRMRLVPALDARDARLTLRNNLAMELVVLAIVIGCSVVLANTPPPH
jgi:putative copper export protein